MRYNIYSGAHKFIRGVLFDFALKCGQSNFSSNTQLDNLFVQFTRLKSIMERHAAHEDRQFHAMLRAKNSNMSESTETEHQQHRIELEKLYSDFQQLMTLSTEDEKISSGYQFYLEYTAYLADSLHHLLSEEQILMPEFWKLYNDDELQNEIIKEFYPDDKEKIVAMFKALFPYMDFYDRKLYFLDLKKSASQLVSEVLFAVKDILSNEEYQNLQNTLFNSSLSSANLVTQFSDFFSPIDASIASQSANMDTNNVSSKIYNTYS